MIIPGAMMSMFLYSFASAMLLWHDNKKEEAFCGLRMQRDISLMRRAMSFRIFDIQEKQDEAV